MAITTTAPRTAGEAAPATGTVADDRYDVLPIRRRLPDRGRVCHSMIARVSGSIEPADLRVRFAAAIERWPALQSSRLWETAVSASPDSPVARERVRQEALRPVREGAAPLRAVMVRYADRTADLVVVAARTHVSRGTLERLVDAVVDTADSGRDAAGVECPPSSVWQSIRPDLAVPGIDWGLGDPTDAGVATAAGLILPVLGPRATEVLVGAMALTLRRYGGEDSVELGRLDADVDAPERLVLRFDRIDEDQTHAAFLARVNAAARVEPTDTLPAVGLLTSSADARRTYLPMLAPVFPLTIQILRRDDGTLDASWWVDEGLVSPQVAERFVASVEWLAGRLSDASSEVSVSASPLLDEAETAEVLRLGGAGVRLDTGGRIDERFDAVAERYPDAVALVDGAGELTYRALAQRAAEVAAGLRARGIAPGRRIGVCLDRDSSLVVAMLGILKAGCTYVPMDLTYPPDRLRYVVENADPPLVVAADGFPAPPGVEVASLEALRAPAGPMTVAGPAGSADDAAYVIFTSGSTGRPKGVVVPHRNVTALLDATASDMALGRRDTWTLFHSSAFDFSVWEIWGCLLTGGRLVVVPYWTARDTDEFHQLLVRHRVTVLNQTPSAFAQLVRADELARGGLSVRLVIFGGEPLDVQLLGPWFARYSPTTCRVVNMFGITETTVHVTAHDVSPIDLLVRSRSVGRALPGWSVSVRDPRGRVLPPGVAGEIYVGGAGVADRYLGQPELTAQRFVRDEHSGERLYRSGDKGRLRPDGSLDHLGRLDNQVKIRGHRIELDEIRSVLAASPQVRAAVVVANQAPPGEGASSRIDAYVVLTDGTDTRQVLDDARRILPGYMIPATITALPAIPLTANGKPDVAKLPRPSAPEPTADQAPATTDALARRTAQILDIWRQLLGVDVTPEDNFFELGGNSLLVVQVLTAMRERGLPRISVRDFYANSTAHQFLALAEKCSLMEGSSS